MVEKRALLLIGIFLLGFVLAVHVILPSSFSVNEDVTNLYNISVNNSDVGQDANITQVNITLPSSFTFLDDSNATEVVSSFTNTSTVLSWTNSSFYLVNGSGLIYFWFNASAATPGVYNLTVVTLNSTGTSSSNISVTVNDTTAPNVTFVNPIIRSNLSGSIILNVSVNDSSTVDTVIFNLTNSSGVQNASFTASNVSDLYWNATLNTSQFPEGIYNISVLANDSVNNLNNSEFVFNLTIDNTDPTATYSCDDSSANVGQTINCTCTPSDSLSGVDSSATSFTSAPSTSGVGTFTLTCTFADNAGNTGNQTTTYTVSSSGGGSSGGSSSSFWSKTFVINDDDFEEGHSQELSEKQRMKVTIDSETHYVGVVDIIGDEAVINITSDPIQITLDVGEDAKVDATNDSRYDLYIKLNGINNSKANLTVESINEPVPSGAGPTTASEDEGPVTEETPSESSGVKGDTNTTGIAIAVIVVLGGVAYFVLKRKKRLKLHGF